MRCYVYAVLLFSFTIYQGVAQTGFILSSQSEVDEFGLTVKDSVLGNLIISSTGIQQLHELRSIRHISGFLYIHNNDRLRNLQGLDSLQSIGGGFIIQDNNRLINLQGLGSLQKIGTHVTVERNESLQNLMGLGPITQIEGDFTVLQNTALVDFQGLEGTRAILGSIDLCDNLNLADFTGLNDVESVGRNIYIYNSAALRDLQGLNKLVSIGGEFDLGENKKLSSLKGLESLESIKDCMYVFNNPSLNSIEELRNLKTLGGTMTIIFNGQLAYCKISGLCNYFLDRSSGINIWRNGKTCSSREELQFPCTQTDPVRSNISDEVRVFPNRTSDLIFIEGIEQTRHQLQIFNSAGQILHDTYVIRNQRIDLSQYPNGIYFVTLRSKGNQINLPITKW